MEIGVGHTIGDALIVAQRWPPHSWRGCFFKHTERQRRLEIVHLERMAAMEKGIPLPEFPLDPPKVRRPRDPRALLFHGHRLDRNGLGCVAALLIIGPFFFFSPSRGRRCRE